MNHLPEDLALRLMQIFTKDEYYALENSCKQVKRPTSFRVNTLRSSLETIKQILEKSHIGYELCSVLPNSIILTSKDDEKRLRELDIYKNGDIYIQGLSSQIPVMYFQRPFSHETGLKILSTNPPISTFPPRGERSEQQLRILDACAAPGGKTSQLAALYPNAEIWAFESQKIRYEKMKYNLEKLGVTIQDTNSHLNPLSFQEKKTAVTCINDSIKNISQYILPPIQLSSKERKGELKVNCINDSIENISQYILPPIQLSPKGRKGELLNLEYFDMILVDAPCSGEGAINYHNTKFLENWSLIHIKKNYARQKVICDAVLPYLKVGGEMIYSTCTLAPEENEAVVHYLLCRYKELFLEKIDFKKNKYIQYKKALTSFGKNIFRKEVSESSLRVVPSEYSEGFYIAKFIKNTTRCK